MILLCYDEPVAPQLQTDEIFWRDIQPWLEQRGYMLRPRYRPDWKPSFTLKDDRFDFEDGYASCRLRISTGEFVMLKRVSQVVHPFEVELTRYFSEESVRSDPRNHCVPLLEVLENAPDHPDLNILVFPFLREFKNPRFRTVGEALEFFRQIFEGLDFMHQCHIAHRDCVRLNIMMDPKPVYPKMYHPRVINYDVDFKSSAKYYSRTARPVKYYLIDFGLSRRYDASNPSPREYPIIGGDKTVPEYQNWKEPLDPFPTDVYYIGNVVGVDFLSPYRELEFMQPLINDMTQTDPSKRPTIEEVVNRFSEIYHNLPKSTLRSRLVRKQESKQGYTVWMRNFKHSFTTLIHILLRRNPMPTPS
ncbi:hypothetical protein ABKN59_011688 [Abortiporus biennis]